MPKDETTTYRIRDIQTSERPRERLEMKGAGALTEAELLGILLRVGIKGENAVQLGQSLLRKFGGLHGLQKASFEEVCNQRGIGRAKAAQIKAAIELGGRLRNLDPDTRPMLNSPGDAANLVMYEMSALEQEHLRVILLDTRNRMIGVEKLYMGSLNSSMVRVGELFRAAIQRNAAAIILVHNHPSGDPTPSPEDATLTRAAQQAGKLLDIDVLDHIIIGRMNYVSMKERGLGFKEG